MLEVYCLYSKEYGFETPFYGSITAAQDGMEKLAKLRAYEGLVLSVRTIDVVT